MSNADLGFPYKRLADAAAAASFSPDGGFNDDLITEVLIRLPVRSLVRFEVVAKSWLSEITDPNFISRHLDRNKGKEPRSLIISGGNLNFLSQMERRIGPPRPETREYFHDPKVRDVVHFYCPKSGTTGEEMRDVGVPYNFLHQPTAIPDRTSRLILNGVVNGIVCAMTQYKIPYDGKNNSIFLWNPATFKSKELPEPNIHPEARSREFSIGFGFDSSSNDYKVVRIVQIAFRGIARAEVCSAKDMSWKEINIESRFLQNIFHFTFDAFIGGVLYWLACDEMITLDLSKEEFDNHIRLPMLTCRTCTKLVEFKDSVALSSFSASHPTKPYKLSFWTLDDQSGKGTWSRKYSFEVFTGLSKILCHLRNGDIVGGLAGGMFFYDPRNKKKVLELPRHTQIRQVYQYTETLVSIPGFKQVKYRPGEDIVDKILLPPIDGRMRRTNQEQQQQDQEEGKNAKKVLESGNKVKQLVHIHRKHKECSPDDKACGSSYV